MIRPRCVRSSTAAVTILTATAIGAPLACADGAELAAEQPPAHDAAAVPDVAPLEDAGVVLDASSDAAAAPCSPAGFCYEPVPVHAPLEAISAHSMTDAWAVGGDAILRWDGTSWQPVYRYDDSESGTPMTFHAVVVPKANDVWALGSTFMPERSIVVRYSQRDGGPPAFRASFADEAVVNGSWATPSSDAFWGIGTSGSVLRFRETADGTLTVDRWSPQGEPDDGPYYAWHGLWGFDGDDVYVGGSACTFGACRGLIAHYDGSTWSMTELDDSRMVTGMFGTRTSGQPKQLWLEMFDTLTGSRTVVVVPVSSDGKLGAPLFERTASGCGSFIGSVPSVGAAWFSDGCLVHRWNGSTLDVTPIAVNGEPPGRVNALWAASADAVWVVGTSLP